MQKKTQANIGVVCAQGIGDALLSMIITHNLSLSGHQVTTFSSHLCQLKRWFPGKKIEPFPVQEGFDSIFSKFDTLIVADHAILKPHHNFVNEMLFLKESHFDRTKTMVDNLSLACRHQLKLPYCVKNNGITVPQDLTWKKHPKRIIIHPMSTSVSKNWLPEKFYILCTRLLEHGYQPALCMSKGEQKGWGKLIQGTKFLLPFFPTLDELAAYVYESRLMIGNDSGIGHIASCLNIPTISLFARKSYSNLWRPGWHEGSVLTPPNLLFGARLKQKYWKHLLTVDQAWKHFKKMVEKG